MALDIVVYNAMSLKHKVYPILMFKLWWLRWLNGLLSQGWNVLSSDQSLHLQQHLYFHTAPIWSTSQDFLFPCTLSFDRPYQNIPARGKAGRPFRSFCRCKVALSALAFDGGQKSTTSSRPGILALGKATRNESLRKKRTRSS